jgi:hypothetical protein
MTEKDLQLKVESRRLMWRMGFSTRVDVPLRAFVPGRSPRARYESFTDLDVLGVALAPGFAVRRVIADCKTSSRGSTERMFWIRGVGDFFAADDAWMVRSGGVTAAARQLSARLGISVLEPNDLASLESYHPVTLRLDEGPLALLFEEGKVAAYMKAYTSLDKRLTQLIDYRQFDYWVYEEHRNLQQVVAHLAAAQKHLDPSHPTHRALFIDCAWLYTLSLANAAAHVRAVHVTDIDTALQEYVFGGQVALQEKRRLADLLRRFASQGKGATQDDGVLPPWYRQLLELLTRHVRRPYVTNDELRYAEWIAEAELAKESATVETAFGESFDPLAAKLLADVCGFLVAVANLDPAFRTHARHYLAQPDDSRASTATVEASIPDVDPRGSLLSEDTPASVAEHDVAGEQGRLL